MEKNKKVYYHGNENQLMHVWPEGGGFCERCGVNGSYWNSRYHIDWCKEKGASLNEADHKKE